MKQHWTYEKLSEDYKPITLPLNDEDGSITGKIIINLKSYFDENPELRKSLGWIKHIKYDLENSDYDAQTQKVMYSTKTVDEYTVEDECHFIEKTEEQMLWEELGFDTGIQFIGGIF